MQLQLRQPSQSHIQPCGVRPPGSLITLSRSAASSVLCNNPEQDYNRFGGGFPWRPAEDWICYSFLFGGSLVLFHAERLWPPSHRRANGSPKPKRKLVSFMPKLPQGLRSLGR